MAIATLNELNATVIHCEEISPDLIILRVKSDEALFTFEPGQYAVLGLPGSSPRLGDSFVIMITAKTTGEEIAEGLDAGADDYISKPFSETELRARVRAGMRTHALIHQLKATNEELKATNEELDFVNEKVRKLNDNLELKVQERTEELTATNEELAATNEEQRRTQSQLVQSGKMSAVGELAAGVAHEMNNPLSVVLTYSILIKEKFDSIPVESRERFPDFSDQLYMIKIAAERCNSIVSKLLSFSRQSEAEMEMVELKDVISKTFELIGVQLRHKRIELVKEIDRLPAFRGNLNQLQQVLTNIVLNAVEAMEPCGTLTLNASHSDEAIEISITDTGPGIPRENLERIFEPFFTTKPIGKGTGLGLSIVYGIIQNHGGDITVDSIVGRGTTFHIRLPLAPKKE